MIITQVQSAKKKGPVPLNVQKSAFGEDIYLRPSADEVGSSFLYILMLNIIFKLREMQAAVELTRILSMTQRY